MWWHTRTARLAAATTTFALTLLFVPRALVGREADALFDGERDAQLGLARAVADAAEQDAGRGAFHTGSARFDAEWTLVTSQMTALGLTQVCHQHPTRCLEFVPAVRAAGDRLAARESYAFAEEAWGVGPFESLDGDVGHAYLGYVALGLGALRMIDPHTPHAELHERIIAALIRRLEAAPDGVLETYPGEAYPADIAAVIGAIGPHTRVTAEDHGPLIARMAGLYRSRFTDRASGYLYQTVRADGHGPARGSGTAIAAYFWSFADAALARELGDAVARGQRSVLGFAGVREYAPGESGGGDVDSGPVVLGVSVSATGFALASARQRGERAQFAALYRTTALFGVPVARGERWRFATGGPLGNALLLAMLTARPP
jgi:hypothetical protein